MGRLDVEEVGDFRSCVVPCPFQPFHPSPLQLRGRSTLTCEDVSETGEREPGTLELTRR